MILFLMMMEYANVDDFNFTNMMFVDVLSRCEVDLFKLCVVIVQQSFNNSLTKIE